MTNLQSEAFKYFLPDLHKSVSIILYNHVKLAVTHEFKLIFLA